MKTLLVILSCLLLSQIALADKKTVVILATGGTIAGQADSHIAKSYSPAQLQVQSLIDQVPQVAQIATIKGEQIAQIASQAMTNEIWLTLARRIQTLLDEGKTDGIVITHGTDTLEETAFFLNLVVDSDKPIVLVGAMRPATSLSADGPLNLFNAVAVAASEQSAKRGVVVVMNESIHSANDVTKYHSYGVEAFKSLRGGPIGSVHYGEVAYHRYIDQPASHRAAFSIKKISALPDVAILLGHANASAIPVNALVQADYQGIIFAGVGNGNLFPAVETALATARNKGVEVVRTSRVATGNTLRNNEVDDDALDFIAGGRLNPQQARILLMVALASGTPHSSLQNLFNRY